jgi:putative transposase
MTIRPELRDELLQECADPREVLAEGGLIKPLTTAIIERCARDGTGSASGLSQAWTPRNQHWHCSQWQPPRRLLKGPQGEIEIALPRDRQASFEPQLVQKPQTRLEGFEDQILTLSARGMTTRDIQAQVQDLSGVEVSPTFLSTITEAVMDEVRQGQNRPWDQISPIVSVDCLPRQGP